MLGPALPPGFKRRREDEEEEEDEGRGVLGPALPPGYKAESSSSEEEEEEEEDGDVFGPMPSRGEAQSSVALDFERRAKRMKDRLLGRDVSLLCSVLLTCEVETWARPDPLDLCRVCFRTSLGRRRERAG